MAHCLAHRWRIAELPLVFVSPFESNIAHSKLSIPWENVCFSGFFRIHGGLLAVGRRLFASVVCLAPRRLDL